MECDCQWRRLSIQCWQQVCLQLLISNASVAAKHEKARKDLVCFSIHTEYSLANGENNWKLTLTELPPIRNRNFYIEDYDMKMIKISYACQKVLLFWRKPVIASFSGIFVSNGAVLSKCVSHRRYYIVIRRARVAWVGRMCVQVDCFNVSRIDFAVWTNARMLCKKMILRWLFRYFVCFFG